MQQNTIIKISTGIITVVLVAILLSQISLHDLIATILAIDSIYLIAAFFLYFCTYLLRSLRFSILLNGTVHLVDLLPIICVHNMMNNILPARTGELSYVYLIKKLQGRSTGEGIATLVMARVFDFIVIIFLLLVTGFLINTLYGLFEDMLWLFYLMLCTLFLILVVMILLGRFFMSVFRQLLSRFRLDQIKIFEFILEKGDETVACLEQINMRRDLVPITIITLMIWIFNFGSLYLILIGMGVSIPIENIIFGAALILLSTILPIHGIAGFGTTEAIWTLVYIPLGMTLNDAIITGFVYHIVILVFITLIGAAGSFIIKRRV